MWLSRQMKAPAPTADADLGMTTITGDSVGVVTRGEVRALPVYGPGGYVWMPESGADFCFHCDGSNSSNCCGSNGILYCEV